MRKASRVLALLLLLTLSGCGRMWNTSGGEDVLYHSGTAKEDCYLCGGGIEALQPFYWGQENIALISLNTFEVIPIEINRYDRLNRRMIGESAAGFGLGDFYVDCNFTEGPDRNARLLDLLIFYCPPRYEAEAQDTRTETFA